MDSIERMRRLNELTKELKQRGFAESSFEAIQQANQIYGDDELSTDVRDGMIKNGSNDKISGEANMDEGAMINMEKKLNKMSDNLNSLTDKMNEIIKALNDMDSRINTLKNRPEHIVEKVVEKPLREAIAQEETKVETHHSTNDDQKPHDEYSTNQRVGNYQSQDVAIDKMFYFGKK